MKSEIGCYRFVSVVIPVLNDAVRLKLCLEALEKQTYPADACEVIVVDNGSTDNTKEVCMEHSAMHYLYESIPGLHRARNAGIAAAKGEILGFTDADCIPATDWIERGVAALAKTQNVGLVAGRVDIFFRDPAKPTAVEFFEKITAFRQKEYIEKMHFAAPANAFTLRSVIDKVGLFDGTLKSGADVEWGNRVFRAGYAQVYADDAVVAHPARRTWEELLRKHRRVAGGLYDIRKKGSYTFRQFAIDLKDDWPDMGYFITIIKHKDLPFLRKITLLFILLLVRIVRFLEMVRLRLGGKSRW